MQCKGKVKQHVANGQDNEELCLHTHFRSRGTDTHHKALPQVLECKACGTKCYPHTSFEFQDKAKEIVKNFLNSTFSEHQPLLGQETVSYYSMGRLSQIGQDFKDYIDTLCKTCTENSTIQQLITIPRPDFSFHQQLGYLDLSERFPILRGQSVTEQILPFSSDISGLIVVDSPFAVVFKGKRGLKELDYSKIMIMDETFLKIGGIQYCLIISVSKEGKLLSWTLSRTRKTQDVDMVFQEALLTYPFPGILITDHFSGYHAMVKRYPNPIIHVSHIHKPPYNRAIIYQRVLSKDDNKIVELQVAINTDIVASNKQQLVQYSIEETRLRKPDAKLRGRPKGSKNKPKNNIQEETKELKHEEPKKDGTPNQNHNQSDHLESKKNIILDQKHELSDQLESKKDTIPDQKQDNKQTKGKKKRGRRNPFRSHSFASITVDLEHKSLSVDDVPDNFISDWISLLLFTLLYHFAGNYLSSNYVENIFSQLKLNLRRGLKADPKKFLQTMFLFTISNHDRINETFVLQELIDTYITEFSPPVGFGHRHYFKGSILPFMFSFTA